MKEGKGVYMRDRYLAQIDALHEKMEEMCRLVEMAIDATVTAMEHMQGDAAKDVSEFEQLIDQKEKDIESLCMRLILEQAPVAGDLRIISSALKMITDMERIGDQADDIAELMIQIQDFTFMENLPHIKEMAEATKEMVQNAIKAYVTQDTKLAKQVIETDDVVDSLFVEVKNEVIKAVKENDDAEDATDFLMIAKYFERIGDHATNIAEWGLYSVTGSKSKDI